MIPSSTGSTHALGTHFLPSLKAPSTHKIHYPVAGTPPVKSDSSSTTPIFWKPDPDETIEVTDLAFTYHDFGISPLTKTATGENVKVNVLEHVFEKTDEYPDDYRDLGPLALDILHKEFFEDETTSSDVFKEPDLQRALLTLAGRFVSEDPELNQDDVYYLLNTDNYLLAEMHSAFASGDSDKIGAVVTLFKSGLLHPDTQHAVAASEDKTSEDKTDVKEEQAPHDPTVLEHLVRVSGDLSRLHQDWERGRCLTFAQRLQVLLEHGAHVEARDLEFNSSGIPLTDAVWKEVMEAGKNSKDPKKDCMNILRSAIRDNATEDEGVAWTEILLTAIQDIDADKATFTEVRTTMESTLHALFDNECKRLADLLKNAPDDSKWDIALATDVHRRLSSMHANLADLKLPMTMPIKEKCEEECENLRLFFTNFMSCPADQWPVLVVQAAEVLTTLAGYLHLQDAALADECETLASEFKNAQTDTWTTEAWESNCKKVLDLQTKMNAHLDARLKHLEPLESLIKQSFLRTHTNRIKENFITNAAQYLSGTEHAGANQRYGAKKFQAPWHPSELLSIRRDLAVLESETPEKTKDSTALARILQATVNGRDDIDWSVKSDDLTRILAATVDDSDDIHLSADSLRSLIMAIPEMNTAQLRTKDEQLQATQLGRSLSRGANLDVGEWDSVARSIAEMASDEAIGRTGHKTIKSEVHEKAVRKINHALAFGAGESSTRGDKSLDAAFVAIGAFPTILIHDSLKLDKTFSKAIKWLAETLDKLPQGHQLSGQTTEAIAGLVARNGGHKSIAALDKRMLNFSGLTPEQWALAKKAGMTAQAKGEKTSPPSLKGKILNVLQNFTFPPQKEAQLPSS
jgi:hypothetical protein